MHKQDGLSLPCRGRQSKTRLLLSSCTIYIISGLARSNTLLSISYAATPWTVTATVKIKSCHVSLAGRTFPSKAWSRVRFACPWLATANLGNSIEGIQI